MPQKSRSTSLSSLSGFQSASSSTSSPPRAAARNPLRLALKGGAVSDASGRLRSVLGHRTTDSSSASSSRRSLSSSEGRGGELRALLTRSTDGPPRLASPAFDADFDELLSADSTIKLSFTPDTLKDPMPPMPPGSDPSPAASPSSAQEVSPRRLQPRPPRSRPLPTDADSFLDQQEEDSGQEDYAAVLFEVINSQPPWEGPGADVEGEPGSRRVRRKPPPKGDRLDELWRDKEATLGKTRPHKPKEGRRDWASERRETHELIEFFSMPPPRSSLDNPRGAVRRPGFGDRDIRLASSDPMLRHADNLAEHLEDACDRPRERDHQTEALASAAVATPVADPVVSDLVGAPPQPDESSTIAAAPSSQNGPVEPLSGPPPKRSLDRRSRSTFSTASIPASFVTARRSSGTEHEVGAATSVAGALSGGRGATQSAFTEEEEQDPSGAGTTSPLEDLHNLVSSTPKPGHLASATDTAAVLRRLRAEMLAVETRDECLQLMDVALESLAASASATDPEAPAIAHVVEYIL